MNGFSPVTVSKSPVASSQRNLTGLPRVAKDIAADVYNNIQKWNDLHIQGAQTVKEIAGQITSNQMKLTPEIENLTEQLHDVLQNLRIYANALEFLASQMKAVAMLREENTPSFLSLSANSLADIVKQIADAYREEFKRKEYVLENIAFSSNKNEVMFHAGCWTYQDCILKHCTNMKLETLLTETGHRKIN